MAGKSFAEESRAAWGLYNPPTIPNADQLRLGCLQRIALATETMARSHADLIREAEYQKEETKRYREHYWKAERRIAALKGVITKLKKAQAEDSAK